MTIRPQHKQKQFAAPGGAASLLFVRPDSKKSALDLPDVPTNQTHYVQTGEHLNKNHSKVKQRKSLAEQIKNKSKTQKHLISLLEELGHTEKANQLRQCCQKFTFLSCGSHIAQKIPDFRCQFKLCPFCAHRSPERRIKKYLPLVGAFLSLAQTDDGKNYYYNDACKLNLTQTQIKGETAAKSFERLKKAVNKFIRRDVMTEFFDGGFCSYEATISRRQNPDGNWHFHCHLIVFRKRVLEYEELARLKSVWAKCSPGAKNLWLSPVYDEGESDYKSLDEALREQIKYAVKPASIEDFDAKRLKEYLKLKNRRMFFTFGTFANFATEPEDWETEEEEAQTELRQKAVKEAAGRLLTPRPDYFEGEACPQCDKPLFEIRATRSAWIQHLSNPHRKKLE